MAQQKRSDFLNKYNCVIDPKYTDAVYCEMDQNKLDISNKTLSMLTTDGGLSKGFAEKWNTLKGDGTGRNLEKITGGSRRRRFRKKSRKTKKSRKQRKQRKSRRH